MKPTMGRYDEDIFKPLQIIVMVCSKFWRGINSYQCIFFDKIDHDHFVDSATCVLLIQKLIF